MAGVRKRTGRATEQPVPVAPDGWVVANPRGIPAGVPLISWRAGTEDEQHWYEGDAFEAPVGLNPARLQAGGFIVPVTADAAEEVAGE